MSDFNNEKQVKTRKEHKCLTCVTKISKGLNAFYQLGIFDGEFYSYYICEFCKKILELDKDIDYYDGITSDSMKENIEYSLGLWIDKIDLENKKVTYHYLKEYEEDEIEIIESFEEFYQKYNK